MLKVMTYKAPNLSDRYFVSGTIDSLAELEVFAHALDLDIFEKASEEPYCFVGNYHPSARDVTQITADVRIGSYVSWTTIGTPPKPNGSALVDEQTTG